MNIQVQEGEFKGHKMLEFYDLDAPPNKDGSEKDRPVLSFGVKKARIIVANVEAIKEFVKSQEGE